MRTSSFFLSLICLTALCTPAWALGPTDVQAKQGYAIDFDTGTVLFAKDEHTRMPTSSMSKVMTMYVVFDALKQGKITMDQTLPVSEKAWRMQGSKMFIHVGDMVRVEDLVRGVMIQSGNDAAIALAEGIGGTEDAFVDMMNKKAADLGLTETRFANASGWPDPNHYSTAHDLTLLARAFIRDFPEYYKYDSEKDFTYNNIKQGNRNPLLYRNIGADGVKTGHTEEGGYGLIGSGVMDGRRVVFTLNGMESMQARADESAKLLSWTLANFMNLAPYADGRPVADVRVAFGQHPVVPAVVGEDLAVTVPKMGFNNVKLTAQIQDPLTAPVKKGDKVGTLTMQIGADGAPMTLPLVAAQDVDQLGFFSRAFATTIYRLTGKGI